jgi:hypothetical protein
MLNLVLIVGLQDLQELPTNSAVMQMELLLTGILVAWQMGLIISGLN